MTDHGSRTAEVMALFRALGTLGPPGERLFSDPYAERFLRAPGCALALLSRVPPIRRLIVRIVDRKWPGARTSAVARTRLVDDLLRGGRTQRRRTGGPSRRRVRCSRVSHR